MDGIIEVKVGGSYISKDSRVAGVRGEANVTNLRISFDKGWDGFAKEVTFWDAYGQNPTKRELTTDFMEKERVYLIPIPPEAMAEAGMFTFVIDGVLENKVMRSMSDRLEVKDSPKADNANNSVDPTPSDLEQMQTQFEAILSDIGDAAKIKEMTVSAEGLSTGVDAYVNKTEKDGVVHLKFGLPKGDTGSSGVYIGVEEPSDPVVNVWIQPNASYAQMDDGGIAVIMEDVETDKAVVLTASGWEGETTPYLQVVFVEGMKDDTEGEVFVSEGASDEQYNAAVYASLRKVAQGTDYIAIKAYGERPSIDIPLTVRVVE